MSQDVKVPVLTVDGPGGAGKGTVCPLSCAATRMAPVG